MVNLVLWLAMGAMLGWLANHLFRLAPSPLPNIAIGIVGALITGYYLTYLLHATTINQANFTWPTLLVPLPGALVLLAVAAVFRRGQPRLS